MTFTAEEIDTDLTVLEIYASAEDDAEPIRWELHDLSDRPATDSRVLWTPVGWDLEGESNSLQRTPELAEIVQEIVDRPGWDAGQHLLLLFYGEGQRTAESFDGNPLAAARLEVEFQAANYPPSVDAGNDQRINQGEVALLQGTASDPDEDALTFLWEKISGPGQISFSLPQSLSTEAAFSQLGTYEISLTASDGQFISTDRLEIVVSLAEFEDLEIRIANPRDDAEERASDGLVFRNSSDLELVDDGSVAQRFVGLRFQVPIPQGAQIQQASIQFTADEADSGPVELLICGQDSDDAPHFLYEARNLSSRLRTSASVEWRPEAWTLRGQAGPAQETPNIASVIQEIVNRPGWQASNSLVILINGSGERTAEAYNGSSAQAPLLRIRWR